MDKDKVSQVVIRKGHSFIVGGLNQYKLLSRRKKFKTYVNALKYSLELSDYYQVQVIEI